MMNKEKPSTLLLAFLKRNKDELNHTIENNQNQEKRIEAAIVNLETGRNPSFSLDAATMLRERKKPHHIHLNILVTGILTDVLVATGIISWVLWGCWWIFAGLISGKS